MKRNKALVILSGGQDSTTCLYMTIEAYGAGNVTAMTFDYGQRHRIEIESAAKVAAMAGVRHVIKNIGGILEPIGPLMEKRKSLDQYMSYEEMTERVGSEVEDTFVPMRNALFLVIAANYAYVEGCVEIIIGISQEDTANYPDTTKKFMKASQKLIDKALGGSFVTLYAPLLNYCKAESIRVAKNTPGCWEALAYTHTSYAGDYPPLDKNHANILRARGFEEAGVPDPLIMRAYREGLMNLPDTDNYKGAAQYALSFD